MAKNEKKKNIYFPPWECFLLHISIQDTSNTIMSGEKIYPTDQMIHPNLWYVIIKGINALGRLPTHTPQTRTMHITRQ